MSVHFLLHLLFPDIIPGNWRFVKTEVWVIGILLYMFSDSFTFYFFLFVYSTFHTVREHLRKTIYMEIIYVQRKCCFSYLYIDVRKLNRYGILKKKFENNHNKNYIDNFPN